jgi:hypothetical protein
MQITMPKERVENTKTFIIFDSNHNNHINQILNHIYLFKQLIPIKKISILKIMIIILSLMMILLYQPPILIIYF